MSAAPRGQGGSAGLSPVAKIIIAWLALGGAVVWFTLQTHLVPGVITVGLGVLCALLIADRFPAPRWVLVLLFALAPWLALIIVPVALFHRAE